MKELESSRKVKMSRRDLLKGSVAGLAGAGLINAGSQGLWGESLSEAVGVKHGRIKQSVVSWCFANHWSLEETCRYAKELGCGSVELVSPRNWPTLRKYGR